MDTVSVWTDVDHNVKVEVVESITVVVVVQGTIFVVLKKKTYYCEPEYPVAQSLPRLTSWL